VLGFAKLAREPAVRLLLQHEAQLLIALADLDAAAPRLLFAGEVEGLLLTVQSPLAGRSSHSRLTDSHLQYLATLKRNHFKSAAETAMVRSLSTRLAGLSVPHEDLDHALDDILPVLERMRVPSTIVHGDFGPWNLRAAGGRIFAYDWEYGQIDGPPLIDQFHHVLFCGYLFHHWSSRQGFKQLLELAASRCQGFSPRQARALATVYLLDMLARLLGEEYDPADPMVVWFREILEQLTPAGRFPVAADEPADATLEKVGASA
jgi:hypothetical protein